MIFQEQHPPIEHQEINKEFISLSSSEISLQMTHLTRAWNLPYILFDRRLQPSTLLSDSIRRQRSHYDGGSHESANNPEVSFCVGLPDSDYSKERPFYTRKWQGGMGVMLPWNEYKNSNTLKLRFGNFPIRKAIKEIINTSFWEKEFEYFDSMSEEEVRSIETLPRNPEEFEIALQICRKAGMLIDGDQAEIVLQAESEGLLLKHATILLPKKRKEVLIRYLEFRLKQMNEKRTVFDLLEQNPNIWWYPQENITQAVKWRSVT